MELYLIIPAIVLNVLLLAGLIVLLPRLLRRQDNHVAEEATRLREMLLDVLSEQESVTLRQAQIGSSLSVVQEQVGKLGNGAAVNLQFSAEALAEAAGFPQLQRRIEGLQGQLGAWFDTNAAERREQQLRDSQSWGGLLELLASMQDRLATLDLAVKQQQPQPSVAADHLLEELDNEMQHMRSLQDEIAGLQWKLRRSVLERETSLANLRAQAQGTPKRGHRAA